MLKKYNKGVKNPRHLQRNIFILFSTWQLKIEPATHRKIDTEVTSFLPTNSKGFLTSKFRSDEINELFRGKHRLWVEILKKSFEDYIKLGKGEVLGFLAVEPENLNFHHHGPAKKKTKKEKKGRISKTKKAYRRLFELLWLCLSGRDVVKQAVKVVPDVIKGATNDINNIAKQRIDHIISQDGKEIERVLPKILGGALEDVYQIPFRLLGNFGKQQLNKLKRGY